MAPGFFAKAGDIAALVQTVAPIVEKVVEKVGDAVGKVMTPAKKVGYLKKYLSNYKS